MNKKGVGLGLVLVGVIVLVLVVGGFFFFSSSNLSSQKADSVAVQCQNACDTNQKSGFCDVARITPDGKSGTCVNLAANSKYDVQTCSNVDCNEAIDQSCIIGLGGEWKTPISDGKCPDSGIKIGSTDSSPVEGQVCCFY